MFTFQNIYKAYKQCRKHKTNTINALQFEQNLLENLWDLTHALQQKTYKIDTSICFLTHSPKLREVFAADFRDRVVHHLVVGELEALYERKFIYDVYNNRKNKGTHSAVKRAKKYMLSQKEGYYLQLDIKGFFYNLDKHILFKTLLDDIEPSRLKDKSNLLWLLHKIIFHDPTKDYVFKGNKKNLDKLPDHKTLFKIPKTKGLPIGNLTSQFFANVYMSRFDHFVKRELKIKGYIRYVDDFVLFDPSKKKLEKCKEEIGLYLKEHLGLRLREDSRLRKSTQGLDFLGYIIRPHYILVRKRVVHNYKAKKAKYLDDYEKQKGNMSLVEIKQFLSVQASFASHCKHVPDRRDKCPWGANSFNLTHKVGRLDETNPFDYSRA
ncbi:MAG: Retron-type RNA-directed DNA polymerase (EC [uncultured Sulfurovum sp.]|uniref:Retron-type RNA-directed DNA polymerase (EC) n=1 Tax=uncultured Sulfurovum sp. TaxID=269237 RepID=A0A6S6TF56_9BACT|nr:MAG: Retron-type RNA-directed DNA polymerase (EC [uncultured Sulfurovum sp.]